MDHGTSYTEWKLAAEDPGKCLEIGLQTPNQLRWSHQGETEYSIKNIKTLFKNIYFKTMKSQTIQQSWKCRMFKSNKTARKKK